MRTEDCRAKENFISGALSAADRDLSLNRGTAVEKPRPEVPAACESLNFNVDALMNTVELLRQRLEPLCLLSRPTPAPETKLQDPEAPLATYIWQEATKIGDVSSVLESLLHRLQV
jgi:hypothetical protein